MRKLLTILSAIFLSSTTTIRLYGCKNTGDYQNEIIFLNKIIKNQDLGILVNSNSTTIFSSLKKANSNLILEEIEIKLGSVTNKSVIIQAIKNSTMYQGEVKVNFRINNEGTEQNDNLLIGVIDTNEVAQINKSQNYEKLMQGIM